MPRTGPDYSLIGVRGIIGRFFRRMEDVLGRSWAPRVGLMIPSDQETETYRHLGMVPQLRQWKGGRLYRALRTDGFLLTNLIFEATLPINRRDWSRDKTGQLPVRVGELAARASQHWEKLLTELFEDNGICYDGQNFFDTDHSLGDSGTQVNALTNSHVPALNVAAAANPTADEMEDVINGVISYLYGYKDDRGEPVNGDAMEWALMVPTNMRAAAVAATRSQFRQSGSTATVPLQDFNVTPITNPRLTSATAIYAFRLDTEMRAAILQTEVEPEVQVLADGSDHTFKADQVLWGIYASRAVGYGEPLHAAKATLS